MASFKVHFKRNFFAGLVTLLPLWLTFFIIWLVFKWVSDISMPVLLPASKYFFGKDYGILVHVVSFILTIFIIWFVGVLTTQIISQRFFGFLESLLTKIPLLSSLYSALRKLTRYIFRHEDRGFKSVGLVQFPKKGTYAICFVLGNCHFKTAGSKIKVFVPHVPSPTTGFLLFVDESEIVHLNMSFDDALRTIISGGIVMPETIDELKEPFPETTEKKEY